MIKINFQDLPNRTTPISASNLNQMQDNIEEAIDEVDENLNREILNINNKFNYSTEETVVGKWIDGKPIYRKTFDFGYLPNAITKDLVTDLDWSICHVINMYGTCIGPTGTVFPINFSNALDSREMISFRTRGTNVIMAITGVDRTSYYAYVTLEYTKTTD